MKNRVIETRTIRMNVIEQGQGPLLLLCHGFPETSHSWRHQVPALAKAGFRVVAPDMRGYGGTEIPTAVDEYTVFHLVGDMVALLDALAEERAVIAGNDWGATVAWQAAQMRPDRFHGVVAMSVPMMAPPPLAPGRIFPQTDEELFYTLYFQNPDIAERELEVDIGRTLRKILFGASGEAGPRRPGNETPNPFGMVSRRRGLLASLRDPDVLPGWLTDADLDTYVQSFKVSGFKGGLNYYRNLDRNWQLQAGLAGKRIEVPALFMVGEHDTGLSIPGMLDIIERMPTLVPQLQDSIVVPGNGHWLPQECPDLVNSAIGNFARRVAC